MKSRSLAARLHMYTLTTERRRSARRKWPQSGQRVEGEPGRQHHAVDHQDANDGWAGSPGTLLTEELACIVLPVPRS